MTNDPSGTLGGPTARTIENSHSSNKKRLADLYLPMGLDQSYLDDIYQRERMARETGATPKTMVYVPCFTYRSVLGILEAEFGKPEFGCDSLQYADGSASSEDRVPKKSTFFQRIIRMM